MSEDQIGYIEQKYGGEIHTFDPLLWRTLSAFCGSISQGIPGCSTNDGGRSIFFMFLI
ncbi:hypothetical protein [Burkholderia sola]